LRQLVADYTARVAVTGYGIALLLTVPVRR
jgi:hypothetical protein